MLIRWICIFYLKSRRSWWRKSVQSNFSLTSTIQEDLLCPIWACLEWIDSTLYFCQGAIMVVASKPTVVADADGFFSVKSKMLVSAIFSIGIRGLYFMLI